MNSTGGPLAWVARLTLLTADGVALERQSGGGIGWRSERARTPV